MNKRCLGLELVSEFLRRSFELQFGAYCPEPGYSIVKAGYELIKYEARNREIDFQSSSGTHLSLIG